MNIRYAALAALLLLLHNANEVESFMVPTTGQGGRNCMPPCSISQQQQRRQVINELYMKQPRSPQPQRRNRPSAATTTSSRTSNKSSSSSSSSTHRTKRDVTANSTTRASMPTSVAETSEKRTHPKKHFHPKNRHPQQRTKEKNTSAPPSRSRSIARGRDPILSLNMNLDFLGKSGQVNAAQRAEELLMRIEALHNDGYYDARPDAVSYNAVINAYAISASRDGASNAKRLLGRMETLSCDDDDDDDNDNEEEQQQQQDSSTVDTTRKRKSFPHAKDTNQLNSNNAVKPNVISFNTVIRAYAKSPSKTGAQEAEEILLQMEQLLQTSDPRNAIRPNAITYNSVIDAWAKRSRRIKHAADRAEWWLYRMMDVHNQQVEDGVLEEEDVVCPDTTSFNTVLHAWAKSRFHHNKADKTEQLLQYMEQLYHDGNENVKPDVVSYTSLIDAYASSISARPGYNNKKRNAEVVSKAEKVLCQMERLWEETGDVSIRPNRISYASVINAYSKQGGVESAKKAQALLERMEQLRDDDEEEEKKKIIGGENGNSIDNIGPDVVCYTSVIDAWARSNSEKAGLHAEEILRHAEALFEKTGDKRVKPNARTYCSVINAHGRSRAYGSAERAEYLLRQMERKYEESQDESIKPTTIVYNAAIDAYARSSFIEKAERAQALLVHMREQCDVEGREYLRPDVITYNSVLNACANAFGDEEMKGRAYRIALRSFKELHKLSSSAKKETTGAMMNGEEREKWGKNNNRQHTAAGMGPTSVSYALLLKALRKLVKSGDERDDMIRRVFELCISGGLVNNGVLSQVKAGVSDYERMGQFGLLLVKCGYDPQQKSDPVDFENCIDAKDLPPQWTRNAGR